MAAKQAVPPAAYTEYLRGRHYLARFTGGDTAKAVGHFEAALHIDPTYAAAYAGLAEAYAQLGGTFRTLDSRDALTRATSAANRALEFDASNAEAYASLAFVRYYLAWDWPGAEAAFTRALEINPGHAAAHNMYANLLTATGRADAAIEHARIAEARDPLSPMAARDVAWHYFFARQYDEAIAQLEKTLVLHPDYLSALTLLGRAYSQQGRHEDAIAAIRRSLAVLGTPDPSFSALLGQVLAAAGRQQEAEEVLARVSGGGNRTTRSAPYLLAVICATLERRDEAFAWLARSVEERDSMLVVAQVDPRLDQLRADPRFAPIIARAGFPTVKR